MTRPGPSTDLAGQTILIVEDAFYLAVEVEEAISRAGGTVLGPFAASRDGLAALAQGRPDAAVVDINLGAGPCFEMADALREADVPFVFLTGYDASAVPDRFADVERLQKPADTAALLRRIVQATAGQRGGSPSAR